MVVSRPSPTHLQLVGSSAGRKIDDNACHGYLWVDAWLQNVLASETYIIFMFSSYFFNLFQGSGILLQ